MFGLRPRIRSQIGVRLALWFIGGTALVLGMTLSAKLAALRTAHRPAWWVGGIAFIGIELIVHLVLWLRGRPSVYDGRGCAIDRPAFEGDNTGSFNPRQRQLALKSGEGR